MNYRRAFQCKKCPQSGGADGCPMWWEYLQSNSATGEELVQKQCGYAALPFFLTEVIKASNRPAAAMESTRNVLAQQLQQGFGALGGVMQQAVERLPPPPVQPVGHMLTIEEMPGQGHCSCSRRKGR